MPGPVPEREANLARPRRRKGKDIIPITKGVARKVTWPRPDPNWHRNAKEIYLSCKKSGQADFYQQSDIAVLRSLMDDLTVAKKNPNSRSGQLLQTIYSQLNNLLVSEGDRRRARIELHEPVEDGPSVSDEAIAEYRRSLGLG